MAVNSLTRMSPYLGGPTGSDQSNPNQGLLMPKLKYRFRVFFENFGISGTTTELTKQVMDFTRPSVSFEEIPIPIYNSTIKLAGKYSWENITCNLRDDAGGQVTRLVGEQLQRQLDFNEMASASAGITYKFTTRFEVLDGGNGTQAPTVLESWEIYGCYLQSVNYGDMNYGTSEAATIALTITFDNAIQTTGGVGTADTTQVSGQGARSTAIASGPATA